MHPRPCSTLPFHDEGFVAIIPALPDLPPGAVGTNPNSLVILCCKTGHRCFLCLILEETTDLLKAEGIAEEGHQAVLAMPLSPYSSSGLLSLVTLYEVQGVDYIIFQEPAEGLPLVLAKLEDILTLNLGLCRLLLSHAPQTGRSASPSPPSRGAPVPH